jgi:hypothetical protein
LASLPSSAGEFAENNAFTDAMSCQNRTLSSVLNNLNSDKLKFLLFHEEV